MTEGYAKSIFGRISVNHELTWCAFISSDAIFPIKEIKGGNDRIWTVVGCPLHRITGEFSF